MPKDADYGRDLATRLKTYFNGRVDEIKFTYDSYIEQELLVSNKSYCIISPNLLERTRLTRNNWQIDIQLVLTVISRVKINDAEAWIDEWLNSWDDLVNRVQEIHVMGRSRCSDIEVDERYDPAMFHTAGRLMCQATLHYQLLQ